MTATATTAEARRRPRSDDLLDAIRRNGWIVGLVGLLILFLAITRIIQPNYAAPGIQGLAISVLPIAFAAIAQAIVVISGGIDLSVGPIMALTSVTAATLMQGQGDAVAVAVVLGILAMGIGLGAINGTLIVWTRVPDIVVTLAMAFVWAGCALLVLDTPGGGAALWLMQAIQGPFFDLAYIPKAAVILAVVVLVFWVPLRRSTLGLSLYALGSDRVAAYRSGVAVGRTKIISYALMGLFAALGGLTLTASTGIGNPVPGNYTLDSVAAAVLGGVSLAGGRGGIVGPILAVVVLYLIRTDLTFLGVNPNLSTVIQGAITIGVVIFGTFVAMRKRRA